MRMGPPQQGQGCSGAFGSLDGINGDQWRREQLRGFNATRRHVLHLACGSIALAFPTGTVRASSYFSGCIQTPAGYQHYRGQEEGFASIDTGIVARNRHIHTTGDAAIDRDLDRALASIADLFHVNPLSGFMIPRDYGTLFNRARLEISITLQVSAKLVRRRCHSSRKNYERNALNRCSKVDVRPPKFSPSVQ